VVIGLVNQRLSHVKYTFAKILCCNILFGCIVSDALAQVPDRVARLDGLRSRHLYYTSKEQNTRPTEYEEDLNRLIALRSRPLEELLDFSNQLERKWQRINWNQYAALMLHVCSEISNRGLNDSRLRLESERFARIALSHAGMFSWEYQSDLVDALGYQRFSLPETAWVRERREKTELWLHAWRRLEKEFDPTFDVNDRKSLPAMRVTPPFATGLPAGTPPSAIKDPKLRAQYEAAIADNNNKAERVNRQLPLHAHGPSFKARAERWLIQAYSQQPRRVGELKRYLQVYVRDYKARARILKRIETNPSP
jgi:hypothetical protein